MNIDQAYLYTLWQKLAFLIVHKTTIWVLFVFFGTAGISWHLANLLDKHNAREADANFARKTALGYTISGIVLWLFSFIMA